MTEVAEFKVAHLYPPFQGKGLAAIVADNGTKYKCQQSQLGQFQEGEDVAIHYTNESFVSKTTGETVSFKKLVSKIAKTNGNPKPTQFTRASTSKSDSEQIFVTALLKAYVEAGMIAADTVTVVEAVKKLRAAYALTFGGSQAQRRDDMDDDIPF